MTQAPFNAPEFPAPDQIQGFWAWDKIHAPRPITPLSGDTIARTLADGFTVGQSEFASFLGMAFWHVNYYAYFAFYPLDDLGGESIAERGARYEQALDKLVPQVGSLWEEEWLPSLLPDVIRARDLNYASLSDAALVAELDHQIPQHVFRWSIHGKINFILIAASRFSDFYKELVHPEDETEGYEALQGFVTRSLDAGRGLWRLSRIVRNSPSLRKQFDELEAKTLLGALEKSDEGKAFLAELKTYLDEFGWRSDAVYDIADIPWREDPSIPLQTLQGFIRLDEDANPDTLFQRSVKRREELLAHARAAAAGDPAKLAKLEELYEAARRNMQVTEDHAFYIDQMGVNTLRLPVLEAGKRLTQRGLLNSPDDVFYLLLDELKDALINGVDRKAVTAQRRSEMARFAEIVPPLTLGEPPPETDDPFVDAVIVRMLGPVFEPEREPDILRGLPASPGLVRGIAKVVRSLSEASKLQEGDIMVCEMTVPPWTPLFSTVSAVVADTGGILSHCAIVAREYKLPAVVGTVLGTRTIKDGMTITVDGSKGIVRIESR
ncbi:MAG TPA: PEP-utilizing enzyme [Dehalococcoidia bacterium]|nr:PEP-utilizing enzyme [Dehalococcoidia bacterium]